MTTADYDDTEMTLAEFDEVVSVSTRAVVANLGTTVHWDAEPAVLSGASAETRVERVRLAGNETITSSVTLAGT